MFPEISVLGLELVVVLGVTILLCNLAAGRLRVAPPILLLACGALLGFVPDLRAVQLPPEVVLLLFLPALLYWESITISLQEIRSNLRGVVLLGTLLIIVTAGAVAVAVHALGLPWPVAWVLGAAVAPTDATAVGEFAKSLPHRDVTVLRAESLVNDGTALVVYGLAVGVTTGSEHLSFPHVGWLFVLAYGGGALSGVLVAYVVAPIRKRLEDRLLNNVAILVTPFAAYLLAESIHASGVLAVVTCGLIMGQLGPRVGRADTRQQTESFWSLSTFVLNGALFVLVGLDTQSAARGLSGTTLAKDVGMVGVVAVTLVVVRFIFLYVTAHLIRLIDRRPQQLLRRVSNKSRVVSAMAGFRGAVSLAVALSVPEVLDSGAAFPNRDTIIFVTFGVIVVTLVVQGLLLPPIVRWADLPQDTRISQEHQLANTVAAEEALAALPDVAETLDTDPHIVERLRREYDKHLRVLRANANAAGTDGEGVEDEEALRYDQQYTELRLAMLARKRATVLRLRHERRIDDSVLLGVQSRLDLEEMRLSRRTVL
jgi:CPA1 family monovalent cation:H+ antiporter